MRFGIVGPPAPVDSTVDTSRITPGVVGFLAFLALLLATWALLRSFTRHLGRIRVSQEPVDSTSRAPGRAGGGGGGDRGGNGTAPADDRARRPPYD